MRIGTNRQDLYIAQVDIRLTIVIRSDGIKMVALDVGELVSQAEKERVTLAEMISRTLTPGQMDEMQSGLCIELASNYGKIEGFMRDVKVPSLDELMGPDELTDSGSAINNTGFGMGLSDDTA